MDRGCGQCNINTHETKHNEQQTNDTGMVRNTSHRNNRSEHNITTEAGIPQHRNNGSEVLCQGVQLGA
jgi:hypothetical protein